MKGYSADNIFLPNHKWLLERATRIRDRHRAEVGNRDLHALERLVPKAIADDACDRAGRIGPRPGLGLTRSRKP